MSLRLSRCETVDINEQTGGILMLGNKANVDEVTRCQQLTRRYLESSGLTRRCTIKLDDDEHPITQEEKTKIEGV